MDQAARLVAVLMGALLTLCGCEGKSSEPTPSHIPPTLAQRFYPPEGWTWGRLEVPGAKPLRYGVAPPPRSVRAEVLILPDVAEPAEAWFETAHDLISRDYGVWVLDLPGQGGSERASGTGDRLYAASLDPDVAATAAMVDRIIRAGSRGAPLVIVGDGLGAQIALRTLAEAKPDVAGAVLASPALEPRTLRMARPFGDWGALVSLKIGMDRPFVAGEHHWSPPAHASRDRDGVVAAWMQANPDLRTGGASLGWTDAYNRSAAQARDPAELARIAVPVLMLAEARDGAARSACSAAKGCRFVALSGAASPHLAPEAVRGPWLAQTLDFIAQRSAGRPVATPPQAEPTKS